MITFTILDQTKDRISFRVQKKSEFLHCLVKDESIFHMLSIKGTKKDLTIPIDGRHLTNIFQHITRDFDYYNRRANR